MEKIFKNDLPTESKCILPPYPRLMGTYIPINMKDKSYELEENNLKSVVDFSHTSLALQTAINHSPKKIFVIGYDGYGGSLSKKEQDLFMENNILFKEVIGLGYDLISLTRSDYTNLKPGSIFSEIE